MQIYKGKLLLQDHNLLYSLFIFSVCRNAALQQKGFKAPKPYKTGTTIAGIVFKVSKIYIIY